MSDTDPRDDAALLGARDHADEAFAVFYRRHLDVVLRLCARRGLSASDAADVTAETFAAALLSRRRYRSRSGPARAWLLGIASHKLADHGRQRARDRRAVRQLTLEPIELSERDHADYAELLAQESAPRATEALAELPDGQRHAVHARVVEGESYRAIARDLRVSESVARQHVSRGLAALRTRLGKEHT
jgi:RNA polymerase sigma-70 factor (ECF subfamily)